MTIFLTILAVGLGGTVVGGLLEPLFGGKWPRLAFQALLLVELIILQQIPQQIPGSKLLLIQCLESASCGVFVGTLIRMSLRRWPIRLGRVPTDIHGRPLQMSNAQRLDHIAAEHGGRTPTAEEMAEILAMAGEAERTIADLQGQAARGELEEVEIFPRARWRWIALWRTMNWVGIPIVLALLDGMLIPRGVLTLNPDLVYLAALGVFVVLLGLWIYSHLRYYPLPRVPFMLFPAILFLMGIASSIFYVWFLH